MKTLSNSNKSWDDRQNVGRQAVEIFKREAHRQGFVEIIPVGAEFGNEETHEKLKERNDNTAIMLRHQSDCLGLTKKTTVLLQVKGYPNVYPKFTVQADSWIWSRNQNLLYRHVAFVFVSIPDEEIYYEWADLIEIEKNTIYVPQRDWGPITWQEEMKKLKKLLPDKIVISKSHTGGSGTPYFYVDKNKLPMFIDFNNRYNNPKRWGRF